MVLEEPFAVVLLGREVYTLGSLAMGRFFYVCAEYKNLFYLSVQGYLSFCSLKNRTYLTEISLKDFLLDTTTIWSQLLYINA